MVTAKILGIAGSPRHGNTDIIVKEALDAAAEVEGIETDFVSLPDIRVDGGCVACYNCAKATPEWLCRNPDYKGDDVNELFQRMAAADGWLVGVPVYWASIPAQFKNIIDRSMAVEFAGFQFRNIVAGALVCAYDRNGGLERAIADLHSWFHIHDMIPVGTGPDRPDKGIGCYWGAAVLQGWPYPFSSRGGKKRFDESLSKVTEDFIGMRTCRLVGKRVAEMALVVKAGFERVRETQDTNWPYRGTAKE